ncbi:MAG: histidine kinase [Verrucomicrobia bacterium]|nr:histidine kinase [Verrucomicrobiota bacterium]
MIYYRLAILVAFGDFDSVRFVIKTRYHMISRRPSNDVFSLKAMFFGAGAILFAAHSQALDPSKQITQYQQDVWTERDGLPQGSVQTITQTHDGYLWVGTRDGLARFDGSSFTVFRSETHANLESNDIRALSEDSKGNLWIGTFNGGLSRYANGSFHSFTVKDGLPSNGVTEIFEDHDGTLWIGTIAGLVIFDAGKFVPQDSGSEAGELRGWSFCEDSFGRLWTASTTGIHRLENGRFEPVRELDALTNSPVRRLHADASGGIWAATLGAGLCRTKDGALERYTVEQGLPDNDIRTVLKDRSGNVWIGTWKGLSRMQNGTFSTYTKQDGLPHEYVEVLYEDREGSLWIGTRGGGLVRLRDGRFTNFTTQEGLAHDFAKCVFEDQSGAIWIGTHGGGLSRFKDGEWTTFTTDDGLPSKFVWAIGEDNSGTIWVGTGRPAGLSCFKGGKFINYGPRQGLPIEGGVRAILGDAQGNLWIGGDGRGLCLFKDGAFTRYSTRNGLSSNLIRALTHDHEGTLWIGTTQGLCRYRDGKFTTFTTDDGLANNVVYAIYEDQDQVLWVGTQGGLTRYADGRMRSYTMRDGLFQNVIYQILEDAGANLWMSSNRGVFRVSKQAIADFDLGENQSVACVPYGTADGMKAAQCEGATQPAGWKSGDGRLWFPTANGVSVIDPEDAKLIRKPPPVLIEHVYVDGAEISRKASNEYSASAREVRFDYAALDFLSPEKIRFRIKLEGHNNDWTDAGARRIAEYRDLPPGRYQFHVTACTDDGVWNTSGASFAFRLPPHFYQTAWFYALCVLAFAQILWSLHRFRMKRAEAQFSLVLAERGRIARDLHDTLAQGFTGIAFQLEAVLEKLTDAPAQAKDHLNIALNMVRHSLAEARRSVMNLRSAALEQGDLTHALAETTRQIMAGRPMSLEVRETGRKRSLPPKIENQLLRVGQEAITNAFKHSQARAIQVDVDYLPKQVRLTVRDNGIGFDVSKSTTVNGAHFGLLGMGERAKQVRGHLSIRSTPASGTEVVLEIPTS